MTESTSSSRASSNQITAGIALSWMGLIIVLAIAVMRCMIVFAQHTIFDTDPASDEIPLGGMAQAASLWLDALLLGGCGVALLGEWLRKRSMSAAMFLLVMAPLVIVGVHGWSDAGDAWRGATWCAAAVASVTIAHVARDRRMRRLTAAALLAVCAPLIIRGIGQVTWEHAGTVQTFEDTKDEFFRQRGWAADSSAARIYERRLRQPQPIGWFTTSNVFGSVMIFGCVAAMGLMIGAVRARLENGWAAVMGLVAGACMVMLYFTGSKGALLAAALGLALATAPLLHRKLAWVFQTRVGSVVVIAVIVAALAAVTLRGLALPETFAGDKSLLFRWHYQVAAARIAGEHPWNGVGPDGFQDAYVQHRVPRNPEEVQSAHSMFFDWIATLGWPAAACWIALTFWLLARAGKACTSADEQQLLTVGRAELAGLAVIGVAAGITSFLVELSTLDPLSAFVRILGIAGWCVIGLVAHRTVERIDEPWARWSFAAAAIAIIIHAQIEMTVHQPGSVVWAMCALGLAGSGTCTSKKRERPALGIILPGAIMIVSLGVMAAAASATMREAAMYRAAEKLQPLPADRVGAIAARKGAMESLLQAHHDHPPRDSFLLEAAVRQGVLAAHLAHGEEQADLLMFAVAELSKHNYQRTSTVALASGLQHQLARTTSAPSEWAKAIDSARAMTLRDPHGWSAWKRLADVLWEAGRRDEAVNAYQRALECDANFELDELSQMNSEQRAEVRERIDELNK